MNIKSMRIETVFSGFIHLAWLALLCLIIIGESPIKILNSLFTIDSGMAVLLTPLLFSLSFFLGRVAEHFFIAINFCRKNKVDKEKKVKSFTGKEKTKAEIWGNKIFFFSSSSGLIILVPLLYQCQESWNIKLAILVLGGILIIATIVSTLYWRYLDNKVNK